MGHVTQVVGCCCARDYRNYGLGSQQRPVLHETCLQNTKFVVFNNYQSLDSFFYSEVVI